MTRTNVEQVIEDAVRMGHTVHGFRSGGGLRVIRVERQGKLKGYGEHLQANEALRHAAEDFAAGGRPYQQVYGEHGLYSQYLTGSSHAENELDLWLLQGHTLDIKLLDGLIVVELRGLEQTVVDPDTVVRAMRGEAVTWTDHRGITFRCSRVECPSGYTPMASTEIVSMPKGMKEHQVWMYYATRTGKGMDLKSAFDAAFAATPVEDDK